MLRRFLDAEGNAPGTLLIATEGLGPRLSSAGPTITVARYAPRDVGGAFVGHLLLEQPLTKAMTIVQVELVGGNGNGSNGHLPISVRLRTNTDAQPGLYADFVLVAIRFECATHYASLGFQATP